MGNADEFYDHAVLSEEEYSMHRYAPRNNGVL